MAVAADIMTKNVVTVAPETPVREVAEVLAANRFGGVPVIAPDGTVRGMVTEEDLVTRAAQVHLPRHLDFLGGIVYLENPQTFAAEAEKILALNAREIMDTTVDSVAPNTPVETIAARMLDKDLRRVLVLDAEQHVQGIITRADIVRMQTTSERLPEQHEP